jgi:hypothetical protein
MKVRDKTPDGAPDEAKMGAIAGSIIQGSE